VKRRPGTHNARRRQLETLVHRRLFNAYQAAVARAQRVGVVAEPTDDDPDDQARQTASRDVTQDQAWGPRDGPIGRWAVCPDLGRDHAVLHRSIYRSTI
jgi:hypothetical protein